MARGAKPGERRAAKEAHKKMVSLRFSAESLTRLELLSKELKKSKAEVLEGLMRQVKVLARPVREDQGTYEVLSDHAPQDWEEIKARALKVERVESLTGWGDYTAVYRIETAEHAVVGADGEVYAPSAFYFVTE